MRVVTGDGQRGPAGAELSTPLTVRVEDAAGTAARGVRVKFSVTRGPASVGRLLDSVSVTGGDGIASVRAALGASGDTLRVVATIAFLRGRTAQFEAIADDGPTVTAIAPLSVRAGDTITITGTGFAGSAATVRFGDMPVAPLAGATNAQLRAVVPACLAAGPISVGVQVSGAQANLTTVTYATSRTSLALQPYQYVTIPASALGDCVELSGASATYLLAGEFASVPAAPPFTESWQLGVLASAAPNPAVAMRPPAAASPAIRAAAQRGSAQRAFDATLRRLETSIAPAVRGERVAASRAAPTDTTPMDERASLVSSFPSVREFSVVSATDGSAFTTVTARLRYVGDHVIVYTDTTGDGYNLEQLQALSSLTDSHLWSAAVNAFGTEPDVDDNGHVIVLLTPVVNALTRSADCTFTGYVTGFFYPLDQLERAPHSNHGEVFYGIVPDERGRYSCVHGADATQRIIQDTFLHEMQHLISFNQHVLSRGGATEETWLNEGLSHMSEELGSRYFESRYPPPFGRGSIDQLFPDSAGPFIGPLLLNAYLYLNSSLQHSVTAYDGTGSIEDRGATWLFLRWLADQKGDDILHRLEQTSLTGAANVEAASGERFPALFGDFSLALFADSLPGVPRQRVPSRLRFAGHSLRQLMAREAVVSGFPVPFPLTTYLATPGGTLRGSMPSGTVIHAIAPAETSGGPLRLSFTTQTLAPLSPALGAQLGILRLPP